LKVVLVETIDEFPVWEAHSSYGHEDLIFRDVLSCFDRREQRLLIALRHGKTVSEISREMGLTGNASVSRKLARIKKRLTRLLE
jgi:DNA-binding NarL/FixJ family response regulator